MKTGNIVDGIDEIKKRVREIELLTDDLRHASLKKFEFTSLNNLPEKLRNLRKEQQITQETLAMMADVSIGLVSKIEDGDLNVSLRKLKNIMDVFGVEICFK